MLDSSMLGGIRAVILDMDGVIWRGGVPLPGLVTFFEFLHERSLPFILATNNSTQSVASYVERLARLGVQATPDNIVTSAVATAEYIRSAYGPDLRVHIVGEVGLYEAMLAAGFPPVMSDADVVVVGLDTDLTYEKLRRATYLIRSGARFIGTNDDRTFPMPDGLAPGTGSILAALEASTGQQPLVIGKPEPVLFEMALARLGTAPEQTLMVGDRLETDILGAQRVGLRTVLVKTGVTSPETLASSEIQPDLVFDDLGALRAAWTTVVQALQ